MSGSSDNKSKRKAAKRKKIKILLYVLAIVVIIVLLIVAFVMLAQFQAGVNQETAALKREVQDLQTSEEMRNGQVIKYEKSVNDTLDYLERNVTEEIARIYSQLSNRLDQLLTIAYKLRGWRKHSGSLFYNLYRNRVKYTKAEAKCTEDDAWLAAKIFSGSKSSDFLATQLQVVEALWIGYTGNGTWSWSDGEMPDTPRLKWSANAKLDDDSYMYAAVRLNKTSNELEMQTYQATSILGFICERNQGFL